MKDEEKEYAFMNSIDNGFALKKSEMTDEEMAVEYRKTLKQRLIDEDDFERLEKFDENVEDAFLAGLKAGRPQWHDLRKDPTDLPKGYAENTRFLCSVKGETLFLVRYGSFWQSNFEVDAWCKIPTFDKE